MCLLQDLHLNRHRETELDRESISLLLLSSVPHASCLLSNVVSPCLTGSSKHTQDCCLLAISADWRRVSNCDWSEKRSSPSAHHFTELFSDFNAVLCCAEETFTFMSVMLGLLSFLFFLLYLMLQVQPVASSSPVHACSSGLHGWHHLYHLLSQHRDLQLPQTTIRYSVQLSFVYWSFTQGTFYWNTPLCTLYCGSIVAPWTPSLRAQSFL